MYIYIYWFFPHLFITVPQSCLFRLWPQVKLGIKLKFTILMLHIFLQVNNTLLPQFMYLFISFLCQTNLVKCLDI